MTVTVTVTVCPCQADRRRRRRRRPPPGRRTVAVAFAVAGLLPQGPRHTCLRGSRCSRQPHRCRWPRRTCLRRSCCTQKSHRTQHTAPPDRPRSPWRQLIPRTDPRDTGCTDRRKSACLPTESHPGGVSMRRMAVVQGHTRRHYRPGGVSCIAMARDAETRDTRIENSPAAL